jgi:RNA polymerase sigma-70 factor (ECF subfamily)
MVANLSEPTVAAPAEITAVETPARVSLSSEAAARDAELVGRFKSGDEEAFVEIVGRHREKTFALAFRFLKDRADAEEIVQDTFIRAHRGLAGFRGDASLATWLHRIATNLSRNRYQYHLARRRNDTLSLDSVCGNEGSSTLADIIACDSPNPAREAATDDFCEVVLICIARLSAGHREILSLRNGQNKSYGEIARSLGINTGTVKSRIGRARQNLRVLLSQQYPDWSPEASPFAWFEPVRPLGRGYLACL